MKSSEGLVMVNVLLAANADVRACNEAKETPLHMAAFQGSHTMLNHDDKDIGLCGSMCIIMLQ